MAYRKLATPQIGERRHRSAVTQQMSNVRRLLCAELQQPRRHYMEFSSFFVHKTFMQRQKGNTLNKSFGLGKIK